MKILFLAYTSKSYNGHGIKIDRADLTRKMSCLETWVPRIESLGHEVIFFDGSNQTQSFDGTNKTLHCIADESYDYNTDGQGSKMLERLKEAIKWCLDNKNFDYILRIDDGSYVNAYVMDKIYEQLNDVDVLRGDGGGAGIFFSKKVCQDIINYNNDTKIGIEDQAIWSFIYNQPYKIANSNLLCYQYIVSENLFTIHYTNGKRMYFVDDVVSYYYQKLPIDRKVIIGYNYNHMTPMKVNSWDNTFGATPIFYAFDKDSNNWEHYGKLARSAFEPRAVCPFVKNSIKELFLYDLQFDFNNANEKQTFINFLNSVKQGGNIYLFYKNNFDLETLKTLVNIEYTKDSIDLDIDVIKGESGTLLKVTKRDIIMIAQYWTDNLSYGKYTYELNSEYCKGKGYGYYVEKDRDVITKGAEGRAFTWYKPNFILSVLEKFNPEYVLFMDADAVVTDEEYYVEEFIDKNYDIIATEDHGPSKINAGVILFRNTQWVKDFLRKWWEKGNEFPNYKHGLWHDQTCFGLVMDSNPDTADKIKIISNRELNWREPSDQNFIFHAFGYGGVVNRGIDAYYFTKHKIDIGPEYNTLAKLATIYNTDKHHTHNYYNGVYDKAFAPYKDNSSLIVEIGVDRGNSIQIWEKYFKCKVIGLDVDSNILSKDYGKCTVMKCDQASVDDLNAIKPTIMGADIILDDGSHITGHQQVTFAMLFECVRPGGIYVIEDLHTSAYLKRGITQWGDPNKTLTKDMLSEYVSTGKIRSDYLTPEQCKYLEDNIKEVQLFDIRPGDSETSLIYKK